MVSSVAFMTMSTTFCTISVGICDGQIPLFRKAKNSCLPGSSWNSYFRQVRIVPFPGAKRMQATLPKLSRSIMSLPSVHPVTAMNPFIMHVWEWPTPLLEKPNAPWSPICPVFS
jgi:hypothetical protein